MKWSTRFGVSRSPIEAGKHSREHRRLRGMRWPYTTQNFECEKVFGATGTAFIDTEANTKLGDCFGELSGQDSTQSIGFLHEFL